MSNSKGIAVLTGATGGVGALYAVGLAERGYDLVLVGRHQDKLDAVAADVKKKTNAKVETFVANLGEAKDLLRVEDRISSDPAITALVMTQARPVSARRPSSAQRPSTRRFPSTSPR